MTPSSLPRYGVSGIPGRFTYQARQRVGWLVSVTPVVHDVRVPASVLDRKLYDEALAAQLLRVLHTSPLFTTGLKVASSGAADMSP